MRRLSITLAWCLLVAAACGTPTPEGEGPTAWSIDSAAFLFAGSRDGNADIYERRADGEFRRLTAHPAQDIQPRVSPDGAFVVFQSRREAGIDDLFLMPIDGADTDATNITTDDGYDVLPVWSPEGRRIAFMSTRGFELGEGGAPFPGHIYVVNADGAGLVQVTREPLTSSLGPQDWTPDGVGILLSRDVGGQLDIFLLDIVTGAETRLTSDQTDEYGAAVSPDGATIAFHAESSEASQLTLMDADGSNRRPLTTGPGFRYNPRWSPDGRWLSFAMLGADDDVDVMTVNVETGELWPLVATPERENGADWVPGR